jgi:hypothetical protein
MIGALLVKVATATVLTSGGMLAEFIRTEQLAPANRAKARLKRAI